MNKIPSRADLLELIDRLANAQNSGDYPEGLDLERMKNEELQNLAVSLYHSAEYEPDPKDIELCEGLATATAPASAQPFAQATTSEPVTPTPSEKPGGRKAPAKATPGEEKPKRALLYSYRSLQDLARAFNDFLKGVILRFEEEGKEARAQKFASNIIRVNSPKRELIKGLRNGLSILERRGLDDGLPDGLQDFREYQDAGLFARVPLKFILKGMKELTFAEVKVLMTIAAFNDFKERKRNDITHAQISRHSGLHLQTVKTAVMGLKARGILRNDVQTYYVGDGDWTKKSQWQINWNI